MYRWQRGLSTGRLPAKGPAGCSGAGASKGACNAARMASAGGYSSWMWPSVIPALTERRHPG